jgi:hypothetical protein
VHSAFLSLLRIVGGLAHWLANFFNWTAHVDSVALEVQFFVEFD